MARIERCARPTTSPASTLAIQPTRSSGPSGSVRTKECPKFARRAADCGKYFHLNLLRCGITGFEANRYSKLMDQKLSILKLLGRNENRVRFLAGRISTTNHYFLRCDSYG